MNQKNKTTHEFFLTGNRPKSTTNNSILEGDSMIQYIHVIDQDKLQQELQKLNDEQEQYDQINELEYALVNLRSELRREKSNLESSKSNLKLTQIIIDSQIKAMETTMKYTIESLKEKTNREIGNTSGYHNYMDKCVFEQKKEDNTIKTYLKSLENRIVKLEFELGIDEQL